MDYRDDFITQLKKIPKLKLVIDNFLQEWGNDLPIMLFGEIGRFISNSFDSFSESEKKYIFLLIKKGIVTNETRLDVCVATGLLEAMYNTSQENQNWKNLSSILDEYSLAYINDWINNHNSI